MQIVIKMSKKDYELYKADDWNIPKCLRDALANGTLLPEGHGRLIDADAVDTRYSDPEVVETLNEAPTILEADKAESEVENAE